MTPRRHLATLALFTLLTIVHTWPLASAPGGFWRDTADYKLNAWALAWVAHQAPRDPVRLFDANIFHPERRTLAFSEHLLPQAILAAPVRWLGGSAVLAHNVSLLAGFVLSGWAMAVVIGRWTGDWYAGLLAGSLAAFSAYTLTRLAHIQALHTYYWPFALLALDRVMRSGRWGDAARAGVLIALQALASGYWLVFTAVSSIAAAAVRPDWWSRRRAPVLAASAFVAALLLAPVLYQYVQVRREQGFTRRLAEAVEYSAGWRDYASSGARLYGRTPLNPPREARRGTEFLFPGVTALVFAGIAAAAGLAWRDAHARMLAAIASAALVLSFGPGTAVYRWLYEYGFALQAIRAPSRFGAVVLLALAGLAGFGLAWLRARLTARGWSPRAAAAVAVAVVAAAHIEALRAPIRWDVFTGYSPVYQEVAALDRAVIVEIPFHRPRAHSAGADYMLASTAHWKPMVNGYSGFLPRSYGRLWRGGMDRFPDDAAIDALGEAGVTHAVVHRDRLRRRGGDAVLERMERGGRVERVGGDDRVRIYRIVNRP